MTDEEKRELKTLVKEGWSYRDIRGTVTCADSTIKKYIRLFSPNRDKDEER